MNLTVFQKGFIFIALTLLFQFAFVLAIVRLQREYAEAERWADHTKDVITRSHEIHTSVSDAQAAVRGYVVVPDPTFADPYRSAVRELPPQLAALEELVADNPDQQAQARAVRASVDALLAWQGEVERLVREGPGGAALDRMRADSGNVLMINFRKQIEELLTEERRLDRERQAVLERSRSRLNVLFVIGSGVAVAFTFALALAFHRGVARRLAALESNARRLGAGEALPPDPGGGDDEIARVDRAFRDMAAGLLRASDAVRDLYDQAPCGYHSVDPDGKLVAINQTELRWLGYAAGEVIGQVRFASLVSPDSQSVYRATFARVKEIGSAADVEIELVRKDGTTFPVLLNSTAVRDEQGRYLRSRTTLTDLTERKRAETAVKLFADVAQNIPTGLLVYQLDNAGAASELRVRSCNREAALLLGGALDGAVGRPIADVFPAVSSELVRRLVWVAESGAPDDLGEFRYGDPRVAERWWDVRAFALPDRSVGVAFQDVSARKRAEAEVLRLNAELEERVRARTAELEAANRDLAQKNAENEMFVYSVSHDLRSPLVNLQGFSKELDKGGAALAAVLDGAAVPPDVRDQGRAVLGGKMAKSIGFIQSAVLRLSGIIDALLRLSRAGRVEYRREAVEVEKVVGQVVAAAQGTITERGAVVRVGPLPAAWGDRTAIEQVFGNLIGNALTYLDGARPGVIEVGCLPPDAGSESRTYFVRDNGLGIAEAHRQKIFQAFQRAHPGVGSGEGLGLAIVARIAERHRGRVWVESRPGEGSTFFVSLPTVADPHAR